MISCDLPYNEYHRAGEEEQASETFSSSAFFYRQGLPQDDAFITPSAALFPTTPKNLTSASLGPAYTMLADRSKVSIVLIRLYLPVLVSISPMSYPIR
jgi:hypothetical protein